MLSSTVQCSSLGTKCILLMTRFKQPRNLTSFCCVSHAVVKLVPVNKLNCASTIYKQRKKCQHTECIKCFMNCSNIPLLSNHCLESVTLFKKSSFTRNVATDGNRQTDKSKVLEPNAAEAQKLSLLQRFKQMYRDYWYVLVPVHLITSLGWFAGFYYLAKSGVDVIALLESLSISEKVINPLRDSSAGYIALAYALYKIATPIRYTVTLGGTTISINYLKKWGYIKPIPPREKLKEIYQERKATLMRETAEELKLQQEKLKKTSENVIRGYRERAGKPEK